MKVTLILDNFTLLQRIFIKCLNKSTSIKIINLKDGTYGLVIESDVINKDKAELWKRYIDRNKRKKHKNINIVDIFI